MGHNSTCSFDLLRFHVAIRSEPASQHPVYIDMRALSLILTAIAVMTVGSAVNATLQPHGIQIPGATLDLEIKASVDHKNAAKLERWVQESAGQIVLAYGRFPVPAVRVVIVPSQGSRWDDDSPVPFGRVTRSDGETVELYVDLDRSLADLSDDWTATHEFSHLLLPRISWRQKWISEGFASYYQNVLMARAGRYTPDQAIDMLERGFGRGRGSRPELSMNEAAQEGVRRARYKIYWSGAAIALLADVGLRERSGGSESLDVVLDRFQRCCLPSQRRWSGPELFAKFDSLIETPLFMPLYRQYADTAGFPDFEGALQSEVVRNEIFAVRTSTH
jgi:hypothetical protein